MTVFHNGLRANVTKDGRLINITGSPVHAHPRRRRTGRIGSSNVRDARRGAVDGRRRRTTSRRRIDSATLVLFPTGRGARLAWRTAHLAEHAAS